MVRSRLGRFEAIAEPMAPALRRSPRSSVWTADAMSPLGELNEQRTLARYEPQSGPLGFLRHHGTDDARAIAVVLLVIGRGHRGMDVGTGFLEGDVTLDATGPDPALAGRQRATEPGADRPLTDRT